MEMIFDESPNLGQQDSNASLILYTLPTKFKLNHCVLTLLDCLPVADL